MFICKKIFTKEVLNVKIIVEGKGGDKMKEAAGEANMTVITIVLIGVVAAVGAILIPRLMNSSANKSCCQELGGVVSGQYCSGLEGNGAGGYKQTPGKYIQIKSLSGKCDE